MAGLTRKVHCLTTIYKIFTRFSGGLHISNILNECLFQQKIHHKVLVRSTNTNAPDPLDDFAEKLVQEKSAKWDSLRSQKEQFFTKEVQKTHTPDYITIDSYESVQNSSDSSISEGNELDSIIKTLVERDDILALLQKCNEHKCCPSSEVLLELASKFARLGDKSGIEAVQTICKQGNEKEYANQAGYLHFMAEATWVRGNLDSSLEQFHDVYSHNITLRRKVRSMMKYLIEDVLTRRGEAHLVNITKFSKMLASCYGDYTFMAFLWQYCFVSEWFSDQSVATELLEKHDLLRTAVIDRIPIVTMKSLREHNVDVVQRLLETLLRFDMRLQYGQVLRVYFDYRCNQGDLRSCSAIVHSSLELNITLTANQHQKFLSLLLDQQHRHKWLGRSRQTLKQPLNVKPFQFKF